MNIDNRIDAFVKLGNKLSEYLNEGNNQVFEQILVKAEQYNPWFTIQFQRLAIENILTMLSREALENWVGEYEKYDFEDTNKKVGVIMAGNIPVVGFHDFISVLICGYNFIGKLSSSDKFLLPFIAQELINIEPLFRDKIKFEENLLKDFDAVIATGSNNSSRYFDYYFGKYKNIIRKNRNSVAVISGNENKDDLRELGKDVFLYFGMGCRNISKLLLPKGYDISILLDAFEEYNYVSKHTKYYNNYEYNKSLLLINKEKHFDNGFLLLVENSALSSPISVLNYEFYNDLDAEIRRLQMHNDDIQCVLSMEKEVNNVIKFGYSQIPSLMQYADNVDVIRFLEDLRE